MQAQLVNELQFLKEDHRRGKKDGMEYISLRFLDVDAGSVVEFFGSADRFGKLGLPIFQAGRKYLLAVNIYPKQDGRNWGCTLSGVVSESE